jgi:hypothetical protein
MGKIEYTNPIEEPEEPYTLGEPVTITNPIEAPDEEPVIYYSDQPGAGPEDAPEEEDEDEELDDEDDEDGLPKKKAVKSAPQNKAVTQASEQTK